MTSTDQFEFLYLFPPLCNICVIIIYWEYKKEQHSGAWTTGESPQEMNVIEHLTAL